MPDKKVLIVDDDKDLLRLLSRHLLRAGFDVVTAQDGVSAVSVAKKEQPKVIVLDLGLPAGDGFRVLEMLQNLIPVSHIPVVVLTARGAQAEATALSAGAAAFLQKPVSASQLIETVRSVLN
jgi:DNA-binding response OmpR family regulator